MKANKKNICKKVMACGLALSMMAPVTSFAAVQQSSEITGDNTVETGIFNVVLPTEVTFAVDPMELLNKAEDGPNAATPGKESNQIASTNLNIINQSNYAIRVDAYTSLKLNSDIKLQDAEAKVTEASTDKVMYLGIGSLTDAEPEIKDGTTTIKTKYKIENLKASTPAKATENQPIGQKPADTDSYKYDTKISCILDGVLYNADGVPANPAKKNVGGFVFYGKVNSRAPWADGDITANLVFDVQGMSASQYKTEAVGDPTATPEVKPTKVIADTANATKAEKFIKPELPKAGAATNVDEKISITYDLSKNKDDATITSKATRVVSATVMDKDKNDLGALPAGSFTSTYNGTAKTLTFVAGEGFLDAETMKGVYNDFLKAGSVITITFDDGMTTTITIPTP